MNRLLTAGLLAGVSIAGAAVAQETAPAAPAAEAAAPQDFDAGTVLATVDGVDITLGHAIVMRDRLPEQYQNLPDDVLMEGIVEQLVDQALLAAEASAGPDTDPLEVRLHLENERRGTLAARVVQQQVGAALTGGRDRGRLRRADRRLPARQGIQRRAYPRRDRGRGAGRQGPARRRRRLRRARQGEVDRSGLGPAGRRARLVRRGPDGARVRDRGRRAGSPARSRRRCRPSSAGT